MAGGAAQEWARGFDRHIVRTMRRYGGSYDEHVAGSMHAFFTGKGTVELRFEFNEKAYAFTGRGGGCIFEDTTRHEVLELYGNVRATKAMLKDRTFPSLNKWAAACPNAVGGNVGSMPLARRLFAGGVCYEDLMRAAKEAREASGEDVSDGEM